MADSAVAVTAGSGTNIDTRTEGTNGNHRAVVVLGDPATNAGVAPVDATAGLKVDLGSDNDITGTVTANLGATDNAVLDDIASDTEAIKTATQLVDDAVFVDDADWTDDTSKHINIGGVYQSSPHTVTDGDVSPALMDANGRLIVAATDNGASLTVDNAALTELGDAINSSKVDVNIASSAISVGGTAAADDADFTDGTTPGTPAMGVYESTPSTVTDGDLGVVGITEDRQLKVKHTDAIPITDNSGNISIDDGGNVITVDGTVAVTNAGLTELAAAIDTEVQVDVVGAIPAGTNNIGDVDVATIAAGDNNIGNVDVASIAAGDNNIGNVDLASAIPAGTNAIGKLAANSGVDIGDVDVTSIVLPRNLIGPGQPGTAIDSYTHASFNLAAGADQVLVASAASKQIWVYGIGFTVNVAGTVSFQDQDDTAITGVMPFGATGGMVVAPSGNFSMPIWKLGTDKDLEVDVVTSELDGWIDYAIVSV